MMKRSLGILLVAMLLGGLLSASAGEVTVIYPIEGEQPTLTLATAENANVTIVRPWKETPFVQAYQEATGVTLDIRHPSDFSLLFASGDLPDIIFYAWDGYPGGASRAIEDGLILPIEDYIDYAPDYYATLTSNDTWRKQATTPSGHLYGFSYIRTADVLCVSAGLIVRDDWLNELNLDIPQTPDELRDMLIAFRDQKGAIIPWSTTFNNLRLRGLEDGGLTTPFGLIKCDFYQKDGKVHYGYASQELKDVLVWLNGLYQEGLLDKNLATIDTATANSNIMAGISGLNYGSGGSGIGTWMSTMAEDPTFSVTGIGSLVSQAGDVAYSGHYDNPVLAYTSSISTSCKNVELAMQFLNYAWTEEGKLLMNYGIEGVSYEMVDGVPTYTELITNNPDGLTMLQAFVQYSNAGSVSGITFPQQENYIWQYFHLPQQHEALERWSSTDAKLYKIPPLSAPAQVSDDFSAISSEVNTFVRESVLKFITGAQSLDTYDQYLQTLSALGADRMVEIYQSELDVYYAR